MRREPGGDVRWHGALTGHLGIDAVWINPWYPSPMKDAGYDVSDFRDIARGDDLLGCS